jgi:hypothetical protein
MAQPGVQGLGRLIGHLLQADEVCALIFEIVGSMTLCTTWGKPTNRIVQVIMARTYQNHAPPCY